MFYVCQISNNLLGAMDECETIEEAVALVLRIVDENGVEITDEVRAEVDDDWSYMDTSKEWSVCIGKVG